MHVNAAACTGHPPDDASQLLGVVADHAHRHHFVRFRIHRVNGDAVAGTEQLHRTGRARIGQVDLLQVPGRGHAHAAGPVHGDGQGGHQLAPFLSQFHRDRQDIGNRGTEVAAASEARLPASHQKSPTLFAHKEIERPQERTGHPGGGNVVEDDRTRPLQPSGIKPFRIGRELHGKSLCAQDRRERVVRVSRDQQQPRSTDDLDPTLSGVVPGVRVVGRVDAHRIPVTARCRKPVRKPRLASSGLDLDAPAKERCPVALDHKRHTLRHGARNAKFQQERLPRLHTRRCGERFQPEIAHVAFRGDPVIERDLLPQQPLRQAVERLRCKAVGERQQARCAVRGHARKRVMCCEPRARAVASPGEIDPGGRIAQRGFLRIIDQEQPVVRPFRVRENPFPFGEMRFDGRRR